MMMADKITPETLAELRHLHVEHRRITKAIAEFAPISADIPEDLVAEYDVATDRVLRLAHLHLGNLLDALAVAEADLAHREAQLKLTQEHLANSHETIKRMEGEAAAIELAAREKCREIITALADEYVHEHFSYDPSTNAWETRNAAVETYEEALRDAADAIGKLTCEKFGHDWQRWNDITRQCKRCDVQEHGEHLRALLAGDAP